MDSWIWATLAAALLIVEILAPGYFLIYPALGAFVVSGLGLLVPLGLAAQIAAFSLVSALLWAFSFRWYREILRGGRRTLVNSPDRLVGETGRVEDPIEAGRGKVRLGDSVWLARGPDQPRGRAVRVVGVDGTVLLVEAVD